MSDAPGATQNADHTEAAASDGPSTETSDNRPTQPAEPDAVTEPLPLKRLFEVLIRVLIFLRPVTRPPGRFLSVLSSAISISRVPVAASAALFVLMVVPDQTTEVVRTMVQGGYVFTFVCWAFLVSYTAISFAAYCRAALAEDPSLPKWAQWAVYLLAGVGPCAGPVLPVIASWSVHGGLLGAVGLIVFIGWSFYWFLFAPVMVWTGSQVLRNPFQASFVQAVGDSEVPAPAYRWLAATATIFGISLIFLFALVVVFLGSQGNANLELPSVILVYGWAMLLLGVLAVGVGAGKVLAFPLVSALVAIALFWSWLDVNDNHVLPGVWGASAQTSVTKAFQDWADTRTDVVAGQPYPVVIVAAEGGGLRAAYMTALVLEELRLRCPRFQHHLFSVIGVSGGSVGAALAQASVSDDPPLKDASRIACADQPAGKWISSASPAVTAAGADLLRPLLRGALVADLPMRLFPSSGVAALVRHIGYPETADGFETWVSRWSNRSSYLARGIDLAWRESRATAAAKATEPPPRELTWTDYLRSRVDLIRSSFPATLAPQAPPRDPPDAELRSRPFYGPWPKADGRDVPALILLSTDVAGGRRVAISRLNFHAETEAPGRSARLVPDRNCLPPGISGQSGAVDMPQLLTLGDIAPGFGITLTEAAVVSSGFPVMMPAATVPCHGERWRLVDGGYFENSGLTTAFELIDAIEQAAKTRPKITFRIVLVRIENGHATTNAVSEAGATASPDSQYFPELGSPIRAFLGTRNARADLARRTADRAAAAGQFCPQAAPCVRLQQVVIALRPCHTAIPLGWTLSDGARQEIRDQVLGTAVDKPSVTACIEDAGTQRWPDQLSRVIAATSP